jgi:hypothetical protein
MLRAEHFTATLDAPSNGRFLELFLHRVKAGKSFPIHNLV